MSCIILKSLYEPNDKCHLLSRKIKQNVLQAGKSKQAKAPKPKIAVTVPLFFAPCQSQEEKTDASSVFQEFLFRVKGIK